MKRKIFYCFLSISLGLTGLYFMAFVFILGYLGIRPYFNVHIIDAIALIIIVYETIKAGRIFIIVNFILLAISILGLMFLIMHWPLANLLFFLPLFIVMIALFINNSSNKEDKRLTYLILIFPLFRLLLIFSIINHWRVAASLQLTEFFIMFVISIATAIKLYKMRNAALS